MTMMRSGWFLPSIATVLIVSLLFVALKTNDSRRPVLLRQNNDNGIIDKEKGQRLLQLSGWYAVITNNQTLKSKNGVKTIDVSLLTGIKLTMEEDGNLVLCKEPCNPGTHIWESGYHGDPTDEYSCKVQGDGHFLCRNGNGTPIWKTDQNKGGAANWFLAYQPTLNKIAVFENTITSFNIDDPLWLDDTNTATPPVPTASPPTPTASPPVPTVPSPPATDEWYLIVNEEETFRSNGITHYPVKNLANHQLVLESNSNLVLCKGTGGSCDSGVDYLWETETFGTTTQEYSCKVQGDCHFLCREENGTPYWRSNRRRDNPSNCFLAYNPAEQKIAVFEGTIGDFDENDDIWYATTNASGPPSPTLPPPSPTVSPPAPTASPPAPTASPPPPPPPPPPVGTSILLEEGETLSMDNHISVEGAYFIAEVNGDIALYAGTFPNKDRVLFRERINPFSTPYFIRLQGDGHLLARSGTPGNEGGVVFRTKAGVSSKNYNLETFKNGNGDVAGMAVFEEGSYDVVWSSDGTTPSPPGPPPGPPPTPPVPTASPPPPPPPPPPVGTSILLEEGETLSMDNHISVEGAYFIAEVNGDIALYAGTFPNKDRVLFRERINPFSTPYFIRLQGDGHLLARSGTPGNEGGVVFRTKAGVSSKNYNLETFKNGNGDVAGMAVFEEGSYDVVWSSDGTTPSPPGPPPGPPPTPPTGSGGATYFPGNLIRVKEGYRISEGLDIKRIATKDQRVQTISGESRDAMHKWPDAAGVFPNPDIQGYSYVSNSESTPGRGGVGIIDMNNQHQVVNYRKVLSGTTKNCGGGKTAWGTWISCEEHFEGRGMWQVDPISGRSELTVLGDRNPSQGNRRAGMWESFADDTSGADGGKYRAFYSEDRKDGPLRRFTPDNQSQVWEALQQGGTTEYLLLNPGAMTFSWSGSLDAGRANAEANYQHVEGIDIRDGVLYMVSKNFKRLYVLNLASKKYVTSSTSSGSFSNPDQFAWDDHDRRLRKSQRNTHNEYNLTRAVMSEQLMPKESMFQAGQLEYLLDPRNPELYGLNQYPHHSDPSVEDMAVAASATNNPNDSSELTMSTTDDHHRDLLKPKGPIMYFSEDGDSRCGIFGMDADRRFFTILELANGLNPTDETTGIQFSPDKTQLFFAQQNAGFVFQVWRTDGRPFYGDYLNLKHH